MTSSCETDFSPWRWGGSGTQGWMPTYVSILCIPHVIWVWIATVEWYIDRGKPKNSEKKKPIPVSLCPPQIPHGLTRAQTRAFAVGGRRLTTWTMARPRAGQLVLIERKLRELGRHKFHSNINENQSGSYLRCDSGSPVSVVSGYGLDDRLSRFDPRQRQEIFLLTSVSIPTLGPTKPPAQWRPRVLSLGVKRGRGEMLTNQPHLVPTSGVSRSYTSSPLSSCVACSGTALASI
jgi:hypothetical protein